MYLCTIPYNQYINELFGIVGNPSRLMMGRKGAFSSESKFCQNSINYLIASRADCTEVPSAIISLVTPYTK